ncbi:MAG: hypothetical protein ACXVRX_13320 [Solirubrobacteraceae bacterium]
MIATAVSVALACAVAMSAGTALAATPSATFKRKPTTHRVGGRVHHAWPRSGRPPRTALARWLARQVGPTKAQPCRRHVHDKVVKCHRKRPHDKVVKCHRKRPPRTGTPLPGGQLGGSKAHATSAQAFRHLGEDVDPIAYAASASSSNTTTSTGSSNLLLVRSYAIPTDDPSYTRLLN